MWYPLTKRIRRLSPKIRVHDKSYEKKTTTNESWGCYKILILVWSFKSGAQKPPPCGAHDIFKALFVDFINIYILKTQNN